MFGRPVPILTRHWSQLERWPLSIMCPSLAKEETGWYHKPRSTLLLHENNLLSFFSVIPFSRWIVKRWAITPAITSTPIGHFLYSSHSQNTSRLQLDAFLGYLKIFFNADFPGLILYPIIKKNENNKNRFVGATPIPSAWASNSMGGHRPHLFLFFFLLSSTQTDCVC